MTKAVIARRGLVAGLFLTMIAAPAIAATTMPAATPAAHTSPVEAAVDQAMRLTAAGDLAKALQAIEPFAHDAALSPAGKAALGYLLLENNRAAEALAVLGPLADAPSADPAVLYNAARAAVAAGQPQKSRAWLTRATQQDPSSPAGRAMGMMLARQGQVVEAYGLLRLWLKQNPADGDARLQAAALALVLERPNEASEYLQGLDAANPAIQLLRAKVHLQLNEPRQALLLLEPLLAHHPASADLEVRRMTASAYLALHRSKDAIALLSGKTGSEPTSLLVLARAQRQAGDTRAALATLEPLAKHLPEPQQVGDPRPAVGIAVEYGSLLTQTGRAAEAVPVLRRATSLLPDSAAAWGALADALDKTSDKAQAQQARAKANELVKATAAHETRPASASAQASAQPPPQAQFVDLLKAGKYEQARKLADQMLASDGKNPDFIYQIAVVDLAQKRTANGEKRLRQALAVKPDYVPALDDLAVLLAARGAKAEARQLAQKALAIRPGDVSAKRTLDELDKSSPVRPSSKPAADGSARKPPGRR